MIESVFSPLERETPDTSDHSQDEFYAKATAITVSNGTGIVSPTALEFGSSVDEHGAEDTADPPVADETSGGILKMLLRAPSMCLTEVITTSKSDIFSVIKQCQAHLSDKTWKWRFLCYICCREDVSRYTSSELMNLLDLKAQDMPSINRYVSHMSVYMKSWTFEELDLLHVVFSTDLTVDNIRKELEQHSPEEVLRVLTFLHEEIPWTQPELDLVAQTTDLSYLSEQLPCRSQRDIEELLSKNAKRSRKRSRSPSVKPSRSSDGDSLEKLVSVKPEPSPEPSEDIFDLNMDDLMYCINTDLTLETLEDFFPDVELETILQTIKENCDLDNKPLTQGEKILMKQYLKEQKKVEEIVDQFPCRSQEFFTLKYRELEFNATRKTKFKNATEQLVYEAQWSAYLSMGGAGGRSSRRMKSKPEIDLDQVQREAAQIKPVVKVLTPEEQAERARNAEERRKKALLAAEKKAELRREKQRLYEERKALGLIKPNCKRGLSYMLQDVLAGAEHFQSVVGDKKKVQDGQKRRRVQAEHYSPEFEVKKEKPKLIARAREQAKKELKKANKKEKRKELNKRNAGHKRKSESKSRLQLLEAEVVDEEVYEDDVDEEEEDSVSPFDPTNICTDTLVPLHNRKLYVEEFYQPECLVPKLNFTQSNDHEIMLQPDDQILYDDNMGYHIVANYNKNYRSLPVSFPGLYSPDTDQINPVNNIKVRFLLYPQHYELFLLAAPKSNELDPIYEIIKLMMIHYALYFSHSEKLKEVIMEYCERIEASIQENNFSEFMFVIDKWNMLMLELSPNTEEVSKVKNEELDINKTIREEYLSVQERKLPTLEDLNLELFYSSISTEESSPAFNELAKLPVLEPEVLSHNSHVVEPKNVSKVLKYVKPEDYNVNFFRHLQNKTDISRFAMHQILLRIYSRVVSTDSKKLRSYKAFTAEVYGELLPSFTSEVLQKVNLMPHHRFYDLGSGVGNTTFQAALEFGAEVSGGCEIMEHASKLCSLQENLMTKHLAVFGLRELNFDFALLQSFVHNEAVRKNVLDCDVLIINNYLFDVNLNTEVGRLLYGLKTGTKIISLRNFIRPRYKCTGDSIFDRLRVEKHEMSDVLSVSWTANKVPYYISTVEESILPEYLGHNQFSGDVTPRASLTPTPTLSDDHPISDAQVVSTGSLVSPASSDILNEPLPVDSVTKSSHFDSFEGSPDRVSVISSAT